MGAYKSKPNTEELSEEGHNDYISFGASSMQGWRMDQEVNICLVIFFVNKFILSCKRSSELFSVFSSFRVSELNI